MRQPVLSRAKRVVAAIGAIRTKQGIVTSSFAVLWLVVAVLVGVGSPLFVAGRPSLGITESVNTYPSVDPASTTVVDDGSRFASNLFAALEIVVIGFDKDRLVLRTRFSFSVPDETWEYLRKDLSEPASLNDCRDLFLEIRVTDRTYAPPTVIRVPMSAFARSSDYAAWRRDDTMFRADVDLPVSESRSAQYPFDWYWVHAFVAVSLPLPLSLAHEHGNSFQLPTKIFLRVAESVDALDFATALVRERESDRYEQLDILVTTSSERRWYIVAMGIATFSLIGVFGHRLLRKETRPQGGGLIVEASGLILAMLPIRGLLVPSNFLELTLVDGVLGAGVMLVLVFAFFGYGYELRAADHAAGSADRVSPLGADRHGEGASLEVKSVGGAVDSAGRSNVSDAPSGD